MNKILLKTSVCFSYLQKDIHTERKTNMILIYLVQDVKCKQNKQIRREIIDL